MQVKPFRGLRPRADLAARIPSLPYDVLSSEEARELARGDPYSFLHVVKSEIDLDPSIDPDDDRVYDKARENFHAMIANGWFERDEQPAYYLYRLVQGEHRQTGILGAAAVEDYVQGRIRKHELTRPDKERDRTRHLHSVAASVGPVFLAYRGIPELSALVRGLAASDPEVDFTAPDGVQHQLWIVAEPASRGRIEELLRKIPYTYIADGHHRAAAAATVARERLGGPLGYFLAAHFPADQVRVLGYNRLVRDLNGLDSEAFLERVGRAGFEVQPRGRGGSPAHPQTFGMYLRGKWYLLVAGPEIVAESPDPVSRLDVSILSRHLLEPILGIGDPRKDRRVDFAGGARGLEELERRVDRGDHAVAFALHPTSVEEVLSIADAGGVLPPKSTWFDPKLRCGLVILDGEGVRS
jgi:uncharacterized protein (DUF1015 family)